VVASVPELISLLALEHVDDDILRGAAPVTTLQRVFGGQVLAQALVAGARTVEDGRPPHSLHGYFLRPGDPAVPIVYVVERTRDGRSFSTRRVIARQHGRPIFHMTVSFQVVEDGLEHQDAMPAVPEPEGLESLADRIRSSGREVSPDEWGVLDVRYADEGRDSLTVWLRTVGTLPDEPAAARRGPRLCQRPHAARHGAAPARRRLRAPRPHHRLDRPRDVVPPAGAGRRMAALRPGHALGLGRAGPRARADLQPRGRTGGHHRAGGAHAAAQARSRLIAVHSA